MPSLMLLRHAEAIPADGKIRDQERMLSPRGQDEARKIGTYMARHGLLPQRALVSPARRTRQTWELVAAAFTGAAAAGFEERLYDAPAQSIIEIVQAVEAGCPALLVIGHNPGMHRAAVALVAAGDLDARTRLQQGLPTGGLVTIEFAFDSWSKLHPQSGRLTHFVSPEMLKAATE